MSSAVTICFLPKPRGRRESYMCRAYAPLHPGWLASLWVPAARESRACALDSRNNRAVNKRSQVVPSLHSLHAPHYRASYAIPLTPCVPAAELAFHIRLDVGATACTQGKRGGKKYGLRRSSQKLRWGEYIFLHLCCTRINTAKSNIAPSTLALSSHVA